MADGVPVTNCLTAAIGFSLYTSAFWEQMTRGTGWAVIAHYDTDVTGVPNG